jgi:hypothetical protein
MNSLDDIRQIALTDPEQLDIQWDKIDSDPEYKAEFEDLVTKTLGLMPMIEQIHTKLTKGESVAFEGEDSPLTHDQIEEYKDLIENELIAGYQMALMWYKYQKVQEIVGA